MSDDHDDSQDPREPPPPGTSGRGRFREQASEILYRLERAVGQHGAWISEADPRLGDVEHKVAALTGRVDAVAQRRTKPTKNSATKGDSSPEGEEEDDRAEEDRAAALLAHGLGPEPTPEEPVEPVCWPVLDAEQATLVWESLATWLGEVVIPWMCPTRAQLPDCWAVHPEAVTALTWAWETYRTSYTIGSPTSRAEWATRWWPGALEVIGHAIDPAKCTPGFHLMTKQDRDDDREERRGAATDPYAPETAETKAKARRARIMARYGTGPGRSRVLDGGQDSAVYNLSNPDVLRTRPSTPYIWLWLYREAAAEDIARRRRGEHRAPPADYRISPSDTRPRR